MAKPKSVRSLLKRLAPDKIVPPPGPPMSKDELARRLQKPLKRAFADAGLDMSKDGDWIILAMRLAVAIYRGKSPGHPKRWTKKRLRHLAEEISAIKNENRGYSELECCKVLIKKSEKKQYYGVDNPKTLRRRLQHAKRLKERRSAVRATFSSVGAASNA